MLHTHTYTQTRVCADRDSPGVLMSEAEKPYTCGGGSVGGHERLVRGSSSRASLLVCEGGVCREKSAAQTLLYGIEDASTATTQLEAEERRVLSSVHVTVRDASDFSPLSNCGM